MDTGYEPLPYQHGKKKFQGKKEAKTIYKHDHTDHQVGINSKRTPVNKSSNSVDNRPANEHGNRKRNQKTGKHLLRLLVIDTKWGKMYQLIKIRGISSLDPGWEQSSKWRREVHNSEDERSRGVSQKKTKQTKTE